MGSADGAQIKEPSLNAKRRLTQVYMRDKKERGGKYSVAKCCPDLEGEMRRSAWRPLLVSARLINHCVAFNPSPVTRLDHPFIHSLSRTHVRISRSPTTFSPTCPALSCSHTHTHSRSLSHWLPQARYLAFTHPRTLSRLNALSHYTTLLCPHIMIVSRSHWLALFRFTLPRSVSLYTASFCHSAFCLALTLV